MRSTKAPFRDRGLPARQRQPWAGKMPAILNLRCDDRLGLEHGLGGVEALEG